jgi:tetratricopeptide (TPR) repeat protein
VKPPTDIWLWGERASGLIARGRPAQALPWLRRCASAGAGWALLLRCRAKQALGQNLLAEADVTRAFDLDPACGWIFGLSVGPLRLPAGTPARRLFKANASFREEPGCYPARAFIGKLAVMAGRGSEGLAHLDWAVKAATRRPYLFAWRAEARRRLGDLSGAARDLRRALELDPRHAVAWTTQAALWRALGKPGRALEAARRGSRLSRSYEAAPLEAARACLALGDGKGLLLWLERAARRSSRLGWSNLSEGSFAPPPDPRTLLAQPGLSLPPWRGRALAWSGQAALNRGETALAARLLEEAVASAPAFHWARAWLGEAFAALGENKKARRNLQACLQASPRYPRAWIALARLHLESGRPVQALRACRRAAALEPDWAWALYWKGRALAALGRPKQALRDFDQALKLDERFTQARLERRRLLRLAA